MFGANPYMRLSSRCSTSGSSGFLCLVSYVCFLFTSACAVLRSKTMMRIFCRRWSWEISFGWTILRMIHATKHGSLISVYSREGKTESPCSRCRLDCQQNLTSIRGYHSSYDSDKTVSLYDVNTMHWRHHFRRRVGSYSPLFPISNRSDDFQMPKSTPSNLVSW